MGPKVFNFIEKAYQGKKQLKNYFEQSLNENSESFLVYFSVYRSRFISKTFVKTSGDVINNFVRFSLQAFSVFFLIY